MTLLTFVGFADNPGGRVADSEVQDLSRVDNGIERLHQLRNRCREVPPVHVQQIDVISLKLLEGCLKRDAERLRAVTSVIDTLSRRVVGVREAGGKLGGDDHFMAYASLLHPLADPGLGLLVLVVVCAVKLSISIITMTSPNGALRDSRINEVSTLLVEEVKNLKHSLFIALAHHALPRIAKVHRSQAKRRNANAGGGRHDAVEVQEGRRLGRVTEWRRHLEEVVGKL